MGKDPKALGETARGVMRIVGVFALILKQIEPWEQRVGLSFWLATWSPRIHLIRDLINRLMRV